MVTTEPKYIFFLHIRASISIHFLIIFFYRHSFLNIYTYKHVLFVQLVESSSSSSPCTTHIYKYMWRNNNNNGVFGGEYMGFHGERIKNPDEQMNKYMCVYRQLPYSEYNKAAAKGKPAFFWKNSKISFFSTSLARAKKSFFYDVHTREFIHIRRYIVNLINDFHASQIFQH